MGKGQSLNFNRDVVSGWNLQDGVNVDCLFRAEVETDGNSEANEDYTTDEGNETEEEDA